MSIAPGSLPERRYRYRHLQRLLACILAVSLANKTIILLPQLAGVSPMGIILLSLIGFGFPLLCLLAVCRGLREGYLLSLGLGLLYTNGAMRQLQSNLGPIELLSLALAVAIACIAYFLHQRIYGSIVKALSGHSRAV